MKSRLLWGFLGWFFLANALFGNDILPKNPTHAALYSLAIPGGGQFYNEQKTKGWLVAASEVAVFSAAAYAHFQSENYYDKAKQTVDATQKQDYYSQYIDYFNYRQNLLWVGGTCILLSVIDAYVNAHLFTFQLEKEQLRLQFSLSLK